MDLICSVVPLPIQEILEEWNQLNDPELISLQNELDKNTELLQKMASSRPNESDAYEKYVVSIKRRDVQSLCDDVISRCQATINHIHQLTDLVKKAEECEVRCSLFLSLECVS